MRFSRQWLPSGMGLHLLHHENTSLAALVLLVRTGSSHELPHETGLAHFMEHMMFKGSQHFKKGYLDLLAFRHGGETNAFTCRDFTAYYHLCPVSALPELYRLEKDRLEHLEFSVADFKAEKAVVLEELKMYADDVRDTMHEWHMESAYPNQGYGHPVIGTAQSLKECTLETMVNFYRRHYRPENCELLLVSSLADKEILNLLDLKPSNRKQPSAKVDSIFQRISPPAKKRFFRDIQGPKITLSFPCPHFGAQEDAASILIEEVLSGGNTAKLPRLLKDKLKIAQSINVYAESQAQGGIFFIELDITSDTRTAIQKVLHTLGEMASKGIDDAELQQARQRSLTSHFMELERLDEMLFSLSQWLNLKDLSGYLNLPGRIEKVSRESIQTFTQTWLKPENARISVAYPA